MQAPVYRIRYTGAFFCLPSKKLAAAGYFPIQNCCESLHLCGYVAVQQRAAGKVVDQWPSRLLGSISHFSLWK